MALLRPTRRELLLAGVAGAGALAVGTYGGFRLGRRDERQRKVVPPREQPFAPNAFVAIDERGAVTLWLAKTEAGQGVATALPMLLADELGADPASIRLVLPPANEAYGVQWTAVSTSVKDTWLELRRAGAAAREMLVAAAAAGFDVPPEQCSAANGRVVHGPTGRALPFAALVHAAARLPVPASPRLKDPAAFTHIGGVMPRLDHPTKVDGSARFGIDARMPGMAFAVVARCPVPGGKVASFDDAAARAVPGVRDVFAIDSGVCVLADTTHAAIRGREALQVTFDRGPNAGASSARVEQDMHALAETAGALARREGVGAEALAGEGTLVEAEYQLPYLAHATMEPMNCTADVRADGCTVHVPTQSPIGARDTVAEMLGLDRARVVVQPTFAGGAFGRRVEQDFVREAVQASRHAGRPVQVVWTREDDFAHDHYRPCSLHRLRGRVGRDGTPRVWWHRIVTPSLIQSKDPAFAEPIDPVAVEGAVEVPYSIPDLQVELVKVPNPFPLGFWRSVGHSFNAFAVECFLDELAAAASTDPVALRLRLLAGEANARHRGVLELAVRHAGEAPHGDGRGRGVAVHASFGSFVAMVADVHVAAGELRVERVTAAVDCGYAVHPDGVRAQIEGAVAFALSAAFFGDVTFTDGAAVQSNFHDQGLLRIGAMPRVEVHLVQPDVPPPQLGGVGEIGVPPVAPAVANAVFAATGTRLRRLPFTLA